jgi:hypothetical protein
VQTIARNGNTVRIYEDGELKAAVGQDRLLLFIMLAAQILFSPESEE